MGEVIALIRLMPDGVLNDDEIQNILDEIKIVIKEPVKLGRVEVKNIAFGLKGVDVTVMVPDSEGGLDPVVEILSGIKKVDNVEVLMGDLSSLQKVVDKAVKTNVISKNKADRLKSKYAQKVNSIVGKTAEEPKSKKKAKSGK